MILLINIDSVKMPNLALEKVAKYYRQQGQEVLWDMPLYATNADKIYVSCIFKKNRAQAVNYEMYPNALIGGSGYDLSIKLPPEIEAIKPRLNQGFTTRGCIRNCEFCIVPEKEGKIHIVGDLLDLWDGKSKEITIMDNNILALPEHFKLVCQQAIDNKIKIDFNQGLDHRLLKPWMIEILTRTPINGELRFAFDSLRNRKSVIRAIELLKAYGINRAMWYVLVAHKSTIEDDFKRLHMLKFKNQTPYVQRFKYKKEYIPMARWANQRQCFQGMTYQQFCIQEGYDQTRQAK